MTRSWTRWRRPKLTAEGVSLGAAPGTLVHVDAAVMHIDAIAYDAEGVHHHADLVDADAAAWADRRSDEGVVWLNCVGVGHADTLSALGRAWSIHPLVLEDIQHVNQRPKAEEHAPWMFVVLPMPDADGHLEQVSLLLGPGAVLTFQERAGDCFTQVRQRLDNKSSRLRAQGPDYLFYALIDAIVDHYSPVLDAFYSAIDDLEDRALAGQGSPELLRQILELRKRLVTYRRIAHPLEAALRTLLKADDEVPYFSEFVRPYLRDTADHAARVADVIDAQRDLAGGLLDLYRGQAAQEANESMRVLTIIATVFIPLGFIAGLYGMNFDTKSPYNMPELGWSFGYPFALLVMLTSAGGLLTWMWRKGWLRRPPDITREDDPS